jgi:secreted trypsin-like serine protease
MAFYLLLVFFFISAHHVKSAPSPVLETFYPNARVILGKSVSKTEAPFFCSLYVDFASDAGTSLCGCALIGPGLAISAAHCFVKHSQDADPRELFSVARVRVYGELQTLHPSLITLERQTVSVHPLHSSQTMRHDIAVFSVPLFENVEYPYLNNRRQAWSALTASDKLSVVGIGVTETGRASVEYDFLFGLIGRPRIAELSRRECSNPVGVGNLKAWSASVYGDDICAGPLTACMAGRCADSCNGDSGGPLYQLKPGNVTLFGLVSRGSPECGKEGSYPGIYVPIDKYLPFIRGTLQKDPGYAKQSSSGSIRPLLATLILAWTWVLCHG